MKTINLTVPFFSQRENSYIWKQRYEKEITDDETKVIIYKKGTFVTDAEGKEISKKISDYSCNIKMYFNLYSCLLYDF